MRFVLVGISLCLAWIAACRCMSSSQEPAEEQQHGSSSRPQSKGVSSEPGPQLSWSTVLDMFTGRYIYNYCTGRGAHVVKAS
jgi:hypothetical protein